MKKVEWSKSDIISQYIESGNVMYKATLEGIIRQIIRSIKK